MFRHCQQARNTARYHSRSHAEEPRIDIVRRLKAHQGTIHHSQAKEPKDRHCQQARDTARHYSHSQAREPRTGIVSKLEIQQSTTDTHFLKSQRQALSAGWKHSKAPQPLTSWKAKHRHCQQARNIEDTTSTHNLRAHPSLSAQFI